MLKNIIGLLAGLLFGFGLLISGMTDPAKVQGFLDVFGAWDISLALVMGGGLAVAIVGVQLARRQRISWVGDDIEMPTKTKITKRLVIGAMLFGIGWGLVGICPGPGIVLLGTGQWQAYVFIPAMIIGMLVYQWLEPKLN
ncbi:YeeE/YedE family protein [Psychrobacter sp. ANT_H3]|uniref:YeeE/YedE family protein n=1 Tax=Psychrobacter sp. ANT_H3 TaxID=3019444 RepID=UPI0022F16B82|nr:YeeE/YedE family protein [Psychrobacter sp. ANT_H3]MDA5133124.1 YeeE/YedE family protein [Psychrobacter sp. ANT_H3]